MAIPSYQGSGTLVDGIGPISPGIPASIQADDVIFCGVQTSNESVSLDDPQSFSATPVALVGLGTPGTAGSTAITLFMARASSTTMGGPTVSDSGNHQLARCFTVRGCVASENPIQSIYTSLTPTTESAVTLPAGATTLVDCLIAQFVVNATDNAGSQFAGQANPDLANLLERFDANSSQGFGGGYALLTGSKATIGTFSTTTGTLGTASPQVGLTIVLKSTADPTLAGVAGWGVPMGCQGQRVFQPRVRGDLWVQAGDVRAPNNPDQDTWGDNAT